MSASNELSPASLPSPSSPSSLARTSAGALEDIPGAISYSQAVPVDTSPQLYRCDVNGSWDHIAMYEIDDLDTCGKYILLCTTVAYIYIGGDTTLSASEDEVLRTKVAEALKAGTGDLPTIEENVTLKVVREVCDVGAPVYNDFMDAFEDGL